MIEFTHTVNNFSNLELLCEGHAGVKGTSLSCAAASALMAAASAAMEKRNPPRLLIETRDGYCRIICEYNTHTAEIAMVTICGFEWLAKQAPEEVTCRRKSAGKGSVKKNQTISKK